MRRWPAVAASVVVSLALLVRCLDPTEVRVVLTTDLDCSSQVHEAKITVGALGSLDDTTESATVGGCTAGALGDIVLTPGSDPGAALAVEVVLAETGKDVANCHPDAGAGCIFARRALRYLPHTPLELPIALDSACLGIPCTAYQTCVEGKCKEATIVDPSQCHANGCDQTSLQDPPGLAGPDAPTGVNAVPVQAAVVSTLAGSGNPGSADGTGALASFNAPLGVAVDSAGVYVADSGNNLIRKVTSAGVVSRLAGAGKAGYADGIGTGAFFSSPYGVAVDGAGNVYVADEINNRIRKVTSAGVVTTLAGSGAQAVADGTGIAASFNSPTGVAVDSAGNVYVADDGNNRIRKVTSAGVVTTLAGSGAPNYADGTGAAAAFKHPVAVAVDGAGNVYVADGSNERIRKVTSAGVVTTVAGSGTNLSVDGTGTGASFGTPSGVAADSTGHLYVADYSGNQIRRVTTSSSVVTTVAGSGTIGMADGPGALASFRAPAGVALDAAGNLYVADANNHSIRKVTTSGFGQLLVSWAASTGVITGYNAFASATAQPTQTCSTTGATTCTITGLTSGVSYGVTVTATSASGTGAPSAVVTATPN